jgi:hyperosmotically inducible periplasmic protein
MMRSSQNTTRRRLFAALLAAGLAAPVVGCATVNGQESAPQYVSDAAITTKVKANIIKDQALKGFEIDVETLHGTVQLSGFVETPRQKEQATDIAMSVNGVKSVRNDLIVRESSPG